MSGQQLKQTGYEAKRIYITDLTSIALFRNISKEEGWRQSPYRHALGR
ncbi:MAG TPA: hypothetical protein PKV22_05100 [Paludibacteraceae bacterium]|nr:hypothetical protein [Paludibacteraceae bacterium]